MIVLIMAMWGGQPAGSVLAATLTVTNTNDSGAGSLRQGIADAAPGDTIRFSSALSGKTIALSSTLVLSKDLNIDGTMLASRIAVSGNNSVRVFQVETGATVTIAGLKVINGFAPSSEGGGLLSLGTVTIENSIFTGNKALNGGGLSHQSQDGTLTIKNSTFSGNSAIDPSAAFGGGIYNGATASIVNSTFSGNTALNNGFGGGIYSGSGDGLANIEVTNSRFIGNSADSGGGLMNDDYATAFIKGSIFSGNTAMDGGAIFNFQSSHMSITGSSFSSNSSDSDGGAIYSSFRTILQVNKSTFSGNSAGGNGGGLYLGSLFASAVIANSTFLDNSANLSGGAVYNSDVLSVRNSTFTQNNAAGNGGGIFNTSYMELENSTLSGNAAGSAQGAGGLYNTDTMGYANTIIANSLSGSDCISTGTIEQNTNNLVETNTGCGTPFLSSDPLLGPLTDHGGPTQTMALLPGSPAIDAGSDSDLYCRPTDQRGVSRPQGAHCDIGAYEYGVEPVNIQVRIGTNQEGPHRLLPLESEQHRYTGINSGPVEVRSMDGSSILASQQVVYGGGSISEMMGLPAEQLSREYLFPYYNSVAMQSQLRVSNLGNETTSITVTLAGEVLDSFDLQAGEAARKSYPMENSGPLRVASSNTTILASLRVLYGVKSYSELMGFPAEQLTQSYLFPFYDHDTMSSQLRVSNVGAAPTIITVYLADDLLGSYELEAGTTLRKSYPGATGPLRVTSDQEPILASVRILYKAGSYSEMAGFTEEEFSDTYWYPVYDNVNLNSQLQVINVGAGPTTVTVYLAGRQLDSYELQGSDTSSKTYDDYGGPLQVVSSNGPILSTIRALSSTAGFSSLYEMKGLPDTRLSSRYFFPWYNNSALKSELRIAVP